MANGTTPVLRHEEDDPVMDKRHVNPFVRMTAHDNMHSTSGGDVITRRILAPSQPTVVYSDDSKSAAILYGMTPVLHKRGWKSLQKFPCFREHTRNKSLDSSKDSLIKECTLFQTEATWTEAM